MAWAIIPKPGTQHGPCVDSCAHTDCNQLKQLALERCAYCLDALGYDRPYCRALQGDEWAHFDCAVEEAERQKLGGELK